jgi:hypothetical protein
MLAQCDSPVFPLKTPAKSGLPPGPPSRAPTTLDSDANATLARMLPW